VEASDSGYCTVGLLAFASHCCQEICSVVLSLERVGVFVLTDFQIQARAPSVIISLSPLLHAFLTFPVVSITE
jgi:hypothetical protein